MCDFFCNFAPKFYLGDYDRDFEILLACPLCAFGYVVGDAQVLQK